MEQLPRKYRTHCPMSCKTHLDCTCRRVALLLREAFVLLSSLGRGFPALTAGAWIHGCGVNQGFKPQITCHLIPCTSFLLKSPRRWSLLHPQWFHSEEKEAKASLTA